MEDGVFTYLVDLVNNLKEACDITIIYALREQTPENFKEYFNKNVKFIQSKYMQRKINIIQELKAIKELHQIIEEEQPDVVHLHSSKASILGRFAVKDKNTKIIYNPHGFSFLMKDISKIKKMIYWLIEKICMIKPVTIVGCSQGEYEEALKLTKKSLCINNGIDVEKLKKKVSEFSERPIDLTNIKVCTIGRIDYQKNPKYFNTIASKLPNIQFTWIGDGILKEELTSPNITITGWKTREEVLKIVNEHDIFILTSLWEGLPIALLEAMYMKKICIVSDVIGNRDVIKKQSNGFVVKSVDEYVDIINSLEQYDIQKIVNEAREDIEKKYNWKNNIKDYIRLYKEGRKNDIYRSNHS